MGVSTSRRFRLGGWSEMGGLTYFPVKARVQAPVCIYLCCSYLSKEIERSEEVESYLYKISRNAVGASLFLSRNECYVCMCSVYVIVHFSVYYLLSDSLIDCLSSVSPINKPLQLL